MASTMIETNPLERCVGHEMCREFIADLVNYAIANHNVLDPLPVGSHQSGFDDFIGKALLRLMRSLNHTTEGEQIQRVFALCQQTSFQEAANTISQFLSSYKEPLATANSRCYFGFFSVLGSLCAKFYVAQRLECVAFSKTYAENMITDCLNHKIVFDKLHMLALNIDLYGTM